MVNMYEVIMFGRHKNFLSADFHCDSSSVDVICLVLNRAKMFKPEYNIIFVRAAIHSL